MAELSGLGRGVSGAGAAVQGGFKSAGDAVDGAPLVGDDLGGALRDAGAGTGGNVVAAGRKGEESANDLADLLGWLTFLVPAVLLLSRFGPARVAQVRGLTAAERVLRGGSLEHRDLLARRAAFGLPYGVLLRHTSDPLGDLKEGRHDALVAAALEDAGLRDRGPTSR